ncbi:O-antigen ligase family protein [Cetobacterium somerae]|uniref:O-antigen ligase family protein n=1 Tax=Cetobacterium somerae TaxID=188913 RepID=UPI002E7AE2AD|nr:O-antigen ligase family protein [Cetobacterium somerae]WVJ00712.1 O-antigen ligase family protein [Cetobacterium somerae]
MLEFLGYPKLDKKLKYMELFFICILIFGTKGYLILELIPIVYFYIKRKELDLKRIYELIKISLFYKLMLVLVYPYGNMLNETFRAMTGLVFYEFFYLKKRIKFIKKDNWIVLGVTSIYLLSLIWNYFSPGGIESFKLYSEKYKVLLFLPILYYLYKNNIKLLSIIERLLPLCIMGIFIKFIESDFDLEQIYILKGNIISIFSLIVPYTFFCIFNDENYRIKLINTCLVILGFWIIIKAGARGALFSLIISISIGVVLKYRIKGIVIALCGSAILLGIVKANPRLDNHFMKVQDFSTRSRYYLMDAGIYTFKNNIIFGSGRGNTQKYFIEYSEKEFDPHKKLIADYPWEEDVVKNNYLRNFPDTHNIFVDSIAENGVLGIIEAIFMWILIPLNVLFAYLKRKKYLYLGICSSFIGFISAGMSWSLWTKHNLGILYFIVLLYIYVQNIGELESN